MSDEKSFAQAIFVARREEFQRDFERFLTSLETPADARVNEGQRTVDGLHEVFERLAPRVQS